MEAIQAIQRQFEYNDWANRRAIETLRMMPTPSSRAVRALSHILLVEKVWLARLRREEVKPPSEFFPEMPLANCQGLIDENRDQYAAFIGTLDDSSLDAISNFQTLAGGAYQASTRDVLSHVLMHSMYHRGQVSMATREDGGEPLQTDFILFVRESRSEPAAVAAG